MKANELRAAINFGKEIIEEYKASGEQIPRWVTERMLDLYEELVEAISIGE